MTRKEAKDTKGDFAVFALFRGFRVPEPRRQGPLPAADLARACRTLEATDRQIDALVYELYGLTEEEIGIVDGRNH